MVRTPPQEDEEDDDVNLEDDPEIEPPPRPVRTLQTVTDVWVVTHARQVGSTSHEAKRSYLLTVERESIWPIG